MPADSKQDGREFSPEPRRPKTRANTRVPPATVYNL
jgi:hypothetical protein